MAKTKTHNTSNHAHNMNDMHAILLTLTHRLQQLQAQDNAIVAIQSIQNPHGDHAIRTNSITLLTIVRRAQTQSINHSNT